MTNVFYKRGMLVLSLAGVLFSGYISGVKFFSETCAFNQSCPYFLGYPACYYGFTMFLLLFISSLILVFGKISLIKGVKFNVFVSALGVLFALYFAYPEARDMAQGTFNSYFLGLSTCIYGLIFFVLAFVMSLIAQRSRD